MNNDTKEKMKEIKNIENEYGLMIFRMGLTHLCDVGTRNLTNDNVEESINKVMAEGEANKATDTTSIMTPEFQCAIIRCAAELSKFSIWTLFIYIKKHLDISN